MGAFGHSVKIANLWRVVRELDLQAIRQEALASFDLLIASEPIALAERLRVELASAHPWVRVESLTDAREGLAPNAVVVLSTQSPMEPQADAYVRRFTAMRVPVIVVRVSADASPGPSPVPGHLTINELDAAGVAAIGAMLIEAVPMETRLAFAHQMPPCRRAYFDVTIDETSRANATYALTTGLAEVVPVLTVPLNLGDIIILTKNQLLMGYRLVLGSGRDGDPRTLVTELLGVLGGGFLFRQMARQLVGLIPVAGLVPKVAIAYGGTWAIGRAVTLWLTEGREVTSDLVRSLARDGIERGRTIARELIDRTTTGTGRSGRGWFRRRR